MALNLTATERPRTAASGRLLADLKERAERYGRAIEQPGVSDHTRSWLEGAAAGLQSAHDELEWRLRHVEDEAAQVPDPEPERLPEPWVEGTVVRDTAPSWEELRMAGRA